MWQEERHTHHCLILDTSRENYAVLPEKMERDTDVTDIFTRNPPTIGSTMGLVCTQETPEYYLDHVSTPSEILPVYETHGLRY